MLHIYQITHYHNQDENLKSHFDVKYQLVDLIFQLKLGIFG